MIDIKGDNIFRFGQLVGFVMGRELMLTKNLSEADQRKVREGFKERGTDINGITRLGEINAPNTPANRQRKAFQNGHAS